MALTEQEKERIRYHLGYPETTFGNEQAAASIVGGIPRPMQTLFLVEQAIQTLLTNAFAIERVRRVLATLDNLETQIANASCSLAVESVGEITMHPGRSRGEYFPDLLEKEYRRWVNRLADILGVPIYPYSERFRRGGPGRNVPVG